MKEQHESYGKIRVSRFSGNVQFFNSDLFHNGGITIEISKARKERRHNTDYVYSGDTIIELRMTNNQFVDMITSAMNTDGVPCTLEYINGKRMEQIDHVVDKQEVFRNDMKDTQKQYLERIDEILSKMEGNIGKRKAEDIKQDLSTLKNHISSNTNFVMTCFNEAMEDTVTEAKHSISNYIDHKIHSTGLEAIKGNLSQISLKEKDNENDNM